MRRIQGRWLKKFIHAGMEWFQHFRNQVDRLNVFPVADCDTGKNMHQTFLGIRQELEASRTSNASEVARRAARGALLGGRGCSGMILSGFFSGFAEALEGNSGLTSKTLASALELGAHRARERVEAPMEGTILTVGEAAAREASSAAAQSESLLETITAALAGARQALLQTTSQLEPLRQNQVVDAGGLGLVCFLEGIVRHARRQPLDARAHAETFSEIHPAVSLIQPPCPVTDYKFCTEWILQIPATVSLEAVRNNLSEWGREGMAALCGDNLVKIHLHAADPDLLLKRLEGLGKIRWQKVEDMLEQHRHAFSLRERP